jgi:O-methyltransferase
MSILEKVLHKKMISQELSLAIASSRGNVSNSFPSDLSPAEKENISLVQPMTMTSQERLVSLSRAVDHIVTNHIPGDIVECGVWKGGSMMLVARKLLSLGDTKRKLFLFDTYEGMSEPDERDVSAVDNRTAEELLSQADRLNGDNVWCYSSLDEVKANLTKTGYPQEQMVFVKGKVEDTLPHPAIGQIALLRLDTDWYESTKHELETLYDLLVPGGILIIDDYGHWDGCRKAVDEFIEKRKLSLFLNRIDYTGRLAVKN